MQEFWCVRNGKVCIMVQDRHTMRYVYITEAKWRKMTESKKARYIV